MLHVISWCNWNFLQHIVFGEKLVIHQLDDEAKMTECVWIRVPYRYMSCRELKLRTILVFNKNCTCYTSQQQNRLIRRLVLIVIISCRKEDHATCVSNQIIHWISVMGIVALNVQKGNIKIYYKDHRLHFRKKKKKKTKLMKYKSLSWSSKRHLKVSCEKIFSTCDIPHWFSLLICYLHLR